MIFLSGRFIFRDPQHLPSQCRTQVGNILRLQHVLDSQLHVSVRRGEEYGMRIILTGRRVRLGHGLVGVVAEGGRCNSLNGELQSGPTVAEQVDERYPVQVGRGATEKGVKR